MSNSTYQVELGVTPPCIFFGSAALGVRGHQAALQVKNDSGLFPKSFTMNMLENARVLPLLATDILLKQLCFLLLQLMQVLPLLVNCMTWNTWMAMEIFIYALLNAQILFPSFFFTPRPLTSTSNHNSWPDFRKDFAYSGPILSSGNYFAWNCHSQYMETSRWHKILHPPNSR